MPFPLADCGKQLKPSYQGVIETGTLDGQTFRVQAEKIAVLVGKSQVARHLQSHIHTAGWLAGRCIEQLFFDVINMAVENIHNSEKSPLPVYRQWA